MRTKETNVLTDKYIKLIDENHNLIYSYIAKYNLDLDEYYGILALAMCEATPKYDETRGVKYSTFCFRVFSNTVGQHKRSSSFKRVIPQDKYYYMDDDDSFLELSDNSMVEDDILVEDIVTAINNNSILKLYVDGYTPKEIAEKTGYSYQVVIKKLRKAKLEIERVVSK